MPVTPGYSLPYPAGTDAPAGPSQLQALAEAVETALGTRAASSHTHAQSDITGLATALAGKSATSHTHTTLPNFKAVLRRVTGISFDANGVGTCAHLLGYTPTGAVAIPETSSGTANTPVGSLSYYNGQGTSTSFKLRAFKPDGTPYTGTIALLYVAW